MSTGWYFPRILDVIVLGSMKMVLSNYTKSELLGWVMLISGICTSLYNLCNWIIIDHGGAVIGIPGWFRKLFFHPVHGKSQLLRLVNLFVMYPLLYIGYKQIEKNPRKPKAIAELNKLFFWTLIGGFIFNGYNYIKIAQTGLFL
jgi:hypothetical protein